MKRGYYWIQHNGVVEVAYFTPEAFDGLETGKRVTGIWHLP